MQFEQGPLVSVIIPVFNASSYLDECLRSIVEQTYRPIEISIYNDESKVRTYYLICITFQIRGSG
jgi:glycosyltransferase involved in cell wall biosynthesis